MIILGVPLRKKNTGRDIGKMDQPHVPQGACFHGVAGVSLACELEGVLSAISRQDTRSPARSEALETIIHGVLEYELGLGAEGPGYTTLS